MGKWPITMGHGCKIHAPTMATEDLFAPCLNIPVKIGDVEIDQNFFVQEEISPPVILGEPFITAPRMQTKVLDTDVAFAGIRKKLCIRVKYVLLLNEENRFRESIEGHGKAFRSLQMRSAA